MKMRSTLLYTVSPMTRRNNTRYVQLFALIMHIICISGYDLHMLRGKPETFDFPGFTHICGKGRSGQFWLRRITIKKRMRAKLHEVNDLFKRRRHLPIPEQGQWLASVLRGHYTYFAVPGNLRAISTFRTQITRHRLKALRRRSQRPRLSWERMDSLASRWLPPARMLHPYPEARFVV